jgi:hypothetical protein
MNSRGKYHYMSLNTCRVCGMDSGARKVTETEPARFFVVCEACGFKTKPHKVQSEATKEWNWRMPK